MKNLFYALAFMLMGNFAFANNGIENNTAVVSEKSSEIVIEKSSEIVVNFKKKEKEKENAEEKEMDCVAASFCGVSGFLCGANSLSQLMNWIMYYHDVFCD